jgi:hypothetical protein
MIYVAVMPRCLLDNVNSTVTTSTCQGGGRGVESDRSYVEFGPGVDDTSLIAGAIVRRIGRAAILPHLSTQSCPQRFDPTV